MVPFSIGSYIIGPDMIQSACFWDVWGGGWGGKSVTVADYHLVMCDFIHDDKACISASIPKAVSFKML